MNDEMIDTTDWKSWALGILFTVVMATSTMTCSLANARMDKVEKVQDAAALTATDMAVQLASLQSTLKGFTESVNKLDENQVRLVERMDRLMEGIQKDSRRWNSEMDRLQQNRGAH